MANKVNNWKELLKLANEDLEKYSAGIGVYDHEGEFTVTVVRNGEEREYADGYYEDELSDLINDAWAHAKAKNIPDKKVEELAEAYLALTDAEKDEFLRLTGNN